MKHHIPLLYHVHYSDGLLQQWMNEGLGAWLQICKDRSGEVHEVLEVVNAAPGYQVVLFGKAESLYQVVK